MSNSVLFFADFILLHYWPPLTIALLLVFHKEDSNTNGTILHWCTTQFSMLKNTLVARCKMCIPSVNVFFFYSNLCLWWIESVVGNLHDKYKQPWPLSSIVDWIRTWQKLVTGEVVNTFAQSNVTTLHDLRWNLIFMSGKYSCSMVCTCNVYVYAYYMGYNGYVLCWSVACFLKPQST